MDRERRFSDAQLNQIVEEATIYMCACPAQVAVQLRNLRELFQYQRNCEVEPGSDLAVHQVIAESTARVYALMEDCMDQVLTLEGWDRATLRMPEGLRKRRDQLLGLDE